MAKIIGTDLGTTNSVCAVVRGWEAAVIQTAEGGPICPSVVAFNKNGEVLKEDLGLDDDAVAIIVNLRNQVMIQQTRLRTLESTLEIRLVRHTTCLTRYREVFQGADWEDM